MTNKSKFEGSIYRNENVDGAFIVRKCDECGVERNPKEPFMPVHRVRYDPNMRASTIEKTLQICSTCMNLPKYKRAELVES